MDKRRVKGRFVAEVKVGVEAGAQGVEVPVGEKIPRRPRPKFCREYTRRRVAEVIPEIVECFVGKALQGSVPHAKALVSLGGLDKAHLDEPKVRRRGKSLAALLMAGLRAKSADTKTTQRAQNSAEFAETCLEAESTTDCADGTDLQASADGGAKATGKGQHQRARQRQRATATGNGNGQRQRATGNDLRLDGIWVGG